MNPDDGARGGTDRDEGRPRIDLGVIGQRQLVCVQIFRIARHPSNPVALVPGAFIAVTGKGPRDSNESGKTTWEQAVSYLLGDPEWGMYGTGAASVSLLLFEPNTAGTSAADYPPFAAGYIVGLFADPADPLGTAHTVWIKISPKSPYVKVRHAPGRHLVEVDDEDERDALARQVFEGLPGPELGPTTFAERLYGPVPRCLAYLSARGKQRGGPSLLKMDTGTFSPAGIGSALITLTGRAELLEKDQELRKDLSEAMFQLIALREQDAEAEQRNLQQLGSITRRDRARQDLADAERLWALHYARGLFDVLTRNQRLDTKLAGAAARVEECERKLADARRRLDELEDPGALRIAHERAAEQAAAAADRLEAAQQKLGHLRAALEALRRALRHAEARAAGVKGNLAEARTTLEQGRRAAVSAAARTAADQAAASAAAGELESAERGEHGASGRAVRALLAENIRAIALLDALEIPDRLRNAWEARLSLYRDAVCVRHSDLERALSTLRDQPGAIVLACPPRTADSTFEVDDGFDAPNDLHDFLFALAARMRASSSPVAAIDEELGVHVLGGFAEPQTGRAALTDRLTRVLDAARVTLAASTAQRSRAEDALGECFDLVQRLEQRDLAREHEREISRTEQDLAAHLRLLDTVRREHDRAHDAATATQIELTTVELRQAAVREEANRIETELARSRDEHTELQRQIAALDLDYWLERAIGIDEAHRALGWPPDSDGTEGAAGPGERRTEAALRHNAGRLLDQAMNTLEINPTTGEGSPLPELADAIRLRANEGDSVGIRRFADATAFETPAGVLGEWLAGHAERDRDAAAAIAAERAERERNIDFEQRTVNDLQTSLASQQRSIKDRLDQAIAAIEDALDTLNQRAGLYGAQLRRIIVPPATLTDLWKCEVTPCWRRTPTGPMLPYDNITNSAQEKLFSIHLVLAALLASPHPQGRVLILDELGDSLGYHHRREVLTAISDIAREYGITVLGTCQESLIDDAADYCGEILYFEYPSHTEALNLPARMFGYDDHRGRVELTYDAVMTGRNWW